MLACERTFEAETFRLRDLDDPSGRVSSLGIPVTIVSAMAQNPRCCRSSRRRGRAGGCAHRRVPDSTHFLQLERPQECERIVRDALSELDEARKGTRTGAPSASAA